MKGTKKHTVHVKNISKSNGDSKVLQTSLHFPINDDDKIKRYQTKCTELQNKQRVK